MNTQQFPEIAKAVGVQRGGKYLKRIPLPGGGYRYIYKPSQAPGLMAYLAAKPGLVAEAQSINNAGGASLNRAAQSMKSDDDNAFYEAAGHIEVAKKQWKKLSGMVGKAPAGEQRSKMDKIANVLGAKIERAEAKLEAM